MRLFILASILIASTAHLAASDADPLVGKWLMQSITSKGEHGEATMETENWTMTFNADGTYAIEIFFVEKGDKNEGKYRIVGRDGNKLQVETVCDGETESLSVEVTEAGLTVRDAESVTKLVKYNAEVEERRKKHVAVDKAHGSDPANPGPAAGVISSKPWTCVVTVPSKFFQKPETWNLELLANPPNEYGISEGSHVLVKVPRAVGRKELSPQFTGTFFEPPGNNTACANGWVEVTKIAEDRVDCLINLWEDANNHVNGSFWFNPKDAPEPEVAAADSLSQEDRLKASQVAKDYLKFLRENQVDKVGALIHPQVRDVFLEKMVQAKVPENPEVMLDTYRDGVLQWMVVNEMLGGELKKSDGVWCIYSSALAK